MREFFISDLHLDHRNIIWYCNRPFGSVDEMNDFIVDAWNRAVGKSDRIYFLGDMCYGRGSRGINYWMGKLNGNIIFIRGYHDRFSKVRFHDWLILERGGEKFLLIHNPRDAPIGWDGWIIHGHTHNNQPEYPLVNRKNKTVNVSAELVGHRPVSLREMLRLVRGAGATNEKANPRAPKARSVRGLR